MNYGLSARSALQLIKYGDSANPERGLKYSSIVQFYGRGLFIKTSVRYAEGKRPRRSSPRRLVWLDRYPTGGVAAAAVIV